MLAFLFLVLNDHTTKIQSFYNYPNFFELFMADLKIRRGKSISQKTFDQFGKDLGRLLDAFMAQLLAKWMGRDPGNFNKKINGIEPITRNDVKDFYRCLSSVIAKLEKNVEPYQIELEMESTAENEETPEYKNLHEEIRLIKETMKEQGKTLKEQGETIRKLEQQQGSNPGSESAQNSV
jgi:hypothetical protein